MFIFVIIVGGIYGFLTKNSYICANISFRYRMRKYLILLVTILLSAPWNAVAERREPSFSLQRGVELFEAGRWSDARHQFLRVREELPSTAVTEHQMVDYYVVVCAIHLDEADVEKQMLDFMRRHKGSTYNNEIYFALAMHYCDRNEFAKARDEFANVNYKSLTPEKREKYDVRMGYIEFLDKNYDAAYHYFERVNVSSNYADHATYYKAYIEYDRGEYATSKSRFESLKSSDAYAELVPYYLLQIEYKEGNYPYVVREGEELLPKSSKEHATELQRVMAESWFRMNNFRKAADFIRAFEKSGGKMGRNENYILGYSLYRTANYQQAQTALHKVCGSDDALTQNASYHLADCYLKNGDKRMASNAFAMASNDKFDAVIAEDALFNYGKLQYELGGGTFNAAVNILTRYIEKYPASERLQEARELLVAAYFNSSNYANAYNAIKALTNPDSSIRAALQKITYFNALEAYMQGDDEKAEKLLEESVAIGVSPKYGALGAFWLGEIAYGRGDYDKAVEKYRYYLDRAPRSEREYNMALYNLGYAYFSMGNMNNAKKTFSTFVDAYRKGDSYRADAWNRYGDALYSMRDFKAAVGCYEKAATLGTTESYYAEYQRAIALGILGRTSGKISALRSIVDADRGDYVDDATFELGRTYIAQEQYRNGAETLKLFVENYPSSANHTRALLDLGLAYFNLHDAPSSLKYYDMVIAKDPRAVEAKEALRSVREIYVTTGDVDTYFTYAEKAGVECDLSQMARDSLSFESAQKIYVAGRTEEAVAPLENYVASFPKGYYLNDALFYLSDCYLKSERPDDAVRTMFALAERPVSQYTVRVLDKLSQYTWEQGRYEESATAFRQLYDVEMQEPLRNSAMEGYVRAVRAYGDDDKIVAMADDVAAQEFAGETALRESRYAKAKVLQKRGDAAAIDIFRLLSQDVRHAEGAEASYCVIDDTYKAGNMDDAEKLVYEFADKNTPHSYWLGKAFILLGDIYRSKGDMFQARATYQSVVDGYTPADDGIVDEAKARITQLN